MIGEGGKDPTDITKEQWIALLEDRNIIREKDIKLLKLFYEHEARASSLAQKLRMSHYAPINRQVGLLGERIAKELNISAPKRTDGEGPGATMWWNVPFEGEPEGRGFSWSLRPKLREAMESLYDIKSPEEVDVDSQKNFYEGATKQVTVNRYERSKDARDECVKHYGSKCSICGFDFGEKYGEVGKDVIHVHHLVPLSQIGKEYKVDHINDLRPVCANCHVIIHKRNPPYSIDEVKAMLAN